MTKTYLTVAGFSAAFQFIPFEPGQALCLKKVSSPIGYQDAILAHLPYLGAVGYVADEADMVIRGTHSAGRIYDQLNSAIMVTVEFILDNRIICRIASPKEQKKLKKDFRKKEKQLGKKADNVLHHRHFNTNRQNIDTSQAKKLGITPIWEPPRD